MNIPSEVRARIQEIVESGDYDCADNFRAARYDNAEEMLDFADAESRGCCGCFTGEIMVDGVAWQIGFNYGH